jgi:alpha-galactosidase/6-phospho-beta-glucosidase family protein
MTMNIGETLLNNPEDGKLHFFGQIREIRRNVELGINHCHFMDSAEPGHGAPFPELCTSTNKSNKRSEGREPDFKSHPRQSSVNRAANITAYRGLWLG